MTDVSGTYDVVASLGANCSAAHNINLRGLRKAALPFDWTYVVDEAPYRWLAAHLPDRFADLCNRENLERILPGHPEWAEAHKGFLKYIDRGSGFRFVNHFRKPIEEAGEFERVHGMLRRRIDRFCELLGSARRVLLVLATGVAVSDETLTELRQAFMRQFPGADFTISFLRFGAEDEGERSVDEGVFCQTVRRSMNRYDLERTNFEWAFLDGVSLTSGKVGGSFHLSFDVWPKIRLVADFRLKRKTGDA